MTPTLNMKKLFAFAIAISLCAPCYAAPKKVDASKWLNEFRSAQANSGDAMILNNSAKRKVQMQTMMKLQDRAERLFGQSSECWSAANGLVSIYNDEIELVNGSTNVHITASGLARMAWVSGENFNVCETMIEGI